MITSVIIYVPYLHIFLEKDKSLRTTLWYLTFFFCIFLKFMSETLHIVEGLKL